MKCTKCGAEYEGDKCPKCNGPEILINDSDYLKRKREYEETGKINGVIVKSNNTSEKGKPEQNKKYKKKKEFKLPEINFNLNLSKRGIAFLKKNWLRTIIILVVLVAAAAVGSKLYELFKRENMTLYTISEGRIYTAGMLEQRYVCDESNVAYTVDLKHFYEYTLPKELSEKTIIRTVVSDNGKYFAATTYDEQGYGLYVWNEDEVRNIAPEKSEKEVKYISDKGIVLYSDTSYLYESVIDNIALYAYDFNKAAAQSDIKGKLVLIDSNIRTLYLYLKGDNLIYLTSDNKLYCLDFSKVMDKNLKKSLIAENVKDVYGMYNYVKDMYSSSSETVKDSSVSQYLIYNTTDGGFYDYDISEKEKRYIMSLDASGVEIIYERKSSTLYCISMNTVYGGTVSQNEETKLNIIDELSSNLDKCYIYDTDTLCYINRSGQLIAYNKGKQTQIRAGVESGTLSFVRNTESAVTYVADGIQYYRSSILASEIKLQQVSTAIDTSDTLVHKGHIFFLSDSNELCVCTTKGKDYSVMGKVTNYWLE